MTRILITAILFLVTSNAWAKGEADLLSSLNSINKVFTEDATATEYSKRIESAKAQAKTYKNQNPSELEIMNRLNDAVTSVIETHEVILKSWKASEEIRKEAADAYRKAKVVAKYALTLVDTDTIKALELEQKALQQAEYGRRLKGILKEHEDMQKRLLKSAINVTGLATELAQEIVK